MKGQKAPRSFLRECKGKVVYSAYGMAIKVADKMRHKDGEDVHCFRCKGCGGLHIGHVRNIDYDA